VKEDSMTIAEQRTTPERPAEAMRRPNGGIIRAGRLLLLALSILAAAPSPSFAQRLGENLSQVSIEDLMKIEITSASRKEQPTADVAAAVFVITHDDIRRSGMTTIPDLLRMAPGVDVAHMNGNEWAVSVRGFNGVYANKLLVLVDGRSLYSQVFAGVFWDTEDLMLDDIDRIEVIRGPSAAMWGANAVNGVINIITKSTADTQGGLVRVDAGRFGTQGAVRYGGTLGAATYRLYSQWTGRNESLIAPGTGANDASHSTTTGFRADWSAKPDAFVAEGAFTAGQTRALWLNLDPKTAASEPIANEVGDTQGGHVLGRWTHTRAGGGSLQVQSFVEIAGRQGAFAIYDRHVVDVDTQYHTALGLHQDVVAGAGYRFIGERVAGLFGFSLTPESERSSLATAFIQDEIGLFGSRLAVTLGTQVQHDSLSGTGVQPTARAIWTGLPRQRLWAATSRALRTPSMYERGLGLTFPAVPSASGLPLVVTSLGNPAIQTETLVDAEAGYRLEIGTGASVDVTGFVGRYEHLQTTETGQPVIQFVPSPTILVTTEFGNQLEATTRGLEVAVHWAPVRAWRLDGSYSAFHVAPKLSATSSDPNAATSDEGTPRAQWQARSAFSPGTRATISVALIHVGPIVQSHVPGYSRADINAEWRFSNHLSIVAIGQNLLEAAHAEGAGTGSSFMLMTEVPRGASLRLKWTF
jgi:iron complex outermembrane receptor protein